MKKISTMLLALSLISLTHSCQDEELEIQTVSVNPVEQEIIEEETPFTLDQIDDPLLVNQYDNLNTLSKTILKEKLTTFYSDKVDLIIWDSVRLNKDYIYLEEDNENNKTYRFLIDIPRLEGDFIPPLVNVRVNHDIVNNDLLNDLHINDENISEFLTFDLEGVVTNESSNNIVNQSAKGRTDCDCANFILQYHQWGVRTKIEWITSSSNLSVGSGGYSPYISIAPAAVWLRYARQTGNSQILSAFGIVRVAGVGWNKEITAKYMNPPSRTQTINDLYIVGSDPNNFSSFNSHYFYYFPELKGLINSFYNKAWVPQIGGYYTSTSLPFNQHIRRQTFIDSFMSWSYNVQRQNGNLFQYLSNNPNAMEKIFNLFSQYHLDNRDVLIQLDNVYANYSKNKDEQFVKWLSDYLRNNDDISLIQNYVDGNITKSELESIGNTSMIYESFPLTYPDGLEPTKPLAGLVSNFLYSIYYVSTNKVGYYKGLDAKNYMIHLSDTEFSKRGPSPTQTGFFNDKKGRYIYTEKGGWIDMGHFLFYASRAYKNKLNGIDNPIGEAVQDGYKQEFVDEYVASYSAYSYEDLPSDKFGAEFGVNHFNPNSALNFGQQIEKYLNDTLGALRPEQAPNYNNLPNTHPRVGNPSRVNKSTTPVYVNFNP